MNLLALLKLIKKLVLKLQHKWEVVTKKYNPLKYIIIILLFSIQNLMGQGIDSLFIDAHGVNLGYGVEYKLERYAIFDKIDKIKSGEKGIVQITRKYSLSKDLLVTSNPEIKSDHKLLINKKKISDNITLTTICYILPYKYGLTQILFLETYHERNINIENEFINYFIGDSIPKHIENSALIDTIDFVNRKIILGNICHCKGPNKKSFQKKGQMRWTKFQSEQMQKKEITKQRVG